jgi:hypothetical protein
LAPSGGGSRGGCRGASIQAARNRRRSVPVICWQRHRPSAAGALVAALMTMVLLGGCSQGSTAPAANPSASPVPSVPGAVPRADHVLVVVFENKAYQQVIGSAAAPYLTSLAHAGANFTNAHGERHPSQPNYVALFSGSTQGVTDDACPSNWAPRPTWHANYSTAAAVSPATPKTCPVSASPAAPHRTVATPANTTPGSTSPTSPLARTSRCPRCPPISPRCPPSPW